MSGLQVALETSSRSGSVAVRVGDDVREARLESARRHAGDLVPALDRLLRDLGASPRDLESVFVGLGPGSYTGTRVAVATALGLARGAGAALRGVPSFDALAWGELEPGAEGAVLVDARAGAVYFAHYRRDADEVEALVPPCAVSPGELALPMGGVLFADDAAVKAAGLDEAERARARGDAVPTARAVLALGERRLARLGPEDPGSVRPLYLRRFGEQPSRRTRESIEPSGG